ncbi:MAG: zinc-dependent metalloprotease family protein, partial [Myxococcota bacterium]
PGKTPEMCPLQGARAGDGGELKTASTGSCWALVVAVALAVASPGSASDSIEVLVLYTPLAKQGLGGSHEAVAAAVAAEFAEANQVFANSDLDESMSYQVSDVQEICFEERGKIHMDLQWVHQSLEVAARREAAGADVVFLLTGTSNYGGLAWTIYSDSPSQRANAFITVEAFGLGTLSVGHELGHTLGCAHNPEILVLPDPPTDSNYGYIHWQEEPFFRTLLAYATFPDPDGNGQYTCSECAENQLNVFSAPDLWYLYAGPGATSEQICTLRDNQNGTHAAQCPNGATALLPSNDLDSYAIPVGSDLHNNRQQVDDRWDITAAYYDPTLEGGCQEDCSALARANCTTAGGPCGDCLPGRAESADGLCVAVIVPSENSDFADGCYASANSFAPANGDAVEETIDLGSLQALERVDVHFGTFDIATGLPSFGWASSSFLPWNPPAPPAYTWELHASTNSADWTELASGTQDTPADRLIGDENGHHMMWRAWERAGGESAQAARFLKVSVQACSQSPCDYSVGLHEVQAYGTAISAVPGLLPPTLPFLILALGWTAHRRLRRPTRR